MTPGEIRFIGSGHTEANENGGEQNGLEDGIVKRGGLNRSRSSRREEALTQFRVPHSALRT